MHVYETNISTRVERVFTVPPIYDHRKWPCRSSSLEWNTRVELKSIWGEYEMRQTYTLFMKPVNYSLGYNT